MSESPFSLGAIVAMLLTFILEARFAMKISCIALLDASVILPVVSP